MSLKDDAVKTIKTFQEAAGLAGLQWFLHAGTLLGAVRDMDFCPGDEDDIDIGVFDEEFDRMASITEGSWFRVLSRFIYRERVEGVKLQLCDNEVRIDISRMRLNPRNGDRYDIGTLNINGDRVFCVNVYPEIHWRKFGMVNFHGVPCNIPNEPEVLLEYRYGANWRTPIHRDHFDWIKHLPDQQCVRLTYDGLI